jgi:hypothetical protein
MHHHNVRHEMRHGFDGLAPVLVDVGDQVGRRQFPDHVEFDVLGPADLRHGPQSRYWMDAEAGAAHQAIRQPEVADEFRQARHQADDARHSVIWLMRMTQSIDQGHYRSSPRGFLPLRAKIASNTGLGSRRMSLATTPICQGITV